MPSLHSAAGPPGSPVSLTCLAIMEMTCNVLMGTLNPNHSLTLMLEPARGKIFVEHNVL